jgi:ABC-2 type transport system ATP-binding protein
MSAPAIEVEGLRKEYRRRSGRTVALAGLDLRVPEGGVFGFLGPNGSGKTTTIRCLLGLVRPSAGCARVLGEEVPGGLRRAMRRIGAIVEAPALFPSMSGRENLRLLGAIDGIGPRRVDEVLELVGMSARAGDLVKRYSLGMKQRLAIAAALLKDPALLVLDEPANGLDPAGIRDVRELVRTLGAQGRTVFVSSHILSEVEQMCDAVAILDRGRCIRQGTVAEVLASAGSNGLLVRATDLDGARAVLSRAGIGVEPAGDLLRVLLPADAAARVTQTLAAEQIWVTELRPGERSLEELFLELTAGDRRPGRAGAPSGLEEVA